MQLVKKIIIVLTVIAISTFNNNLKVEAQTTVSFQVFYDNLSPYGMWVADADFGYVWIPSVGAGFSPYSTSGHWILTDLGWTWVSDYPWGWAPFHYGRWRYNDFYGWQWIPGNEWGPAWVCWRRARGYYGWAPLAPGVSINIAIGPRYSIPHHQWVFVQERYINDPHINRYYAPHNNNETIIKNSTVINNTYVDNSRHTTYISGPKKDEVQKVTGKQVNPVALKESAKPGQSVKGDELSIYRPSVKNNDTKTGKPVPKKVTDLKDVKTINGKQPPETENDKTAQAKTDEMQNNSDKKQQSDVDNKNQKKENDLKKDPQNKDTKTNPEQNKNKQNNAAKKQQNPKSDAKKSEPPRPK